MIACGRGDHDRRRAPRAPRPPARARWRRTGAPRRRRDGRRRRRAAARCAAPTSDVVAVAPAATGLPLAARAQRRRRARALARGAELLVFLDVDCIPGAALLRALSRAAAARARIAAVRPGRLPAARRRRAGTPSTGLAALARAAPGAPGAAAGRARARRRPRAVLDAVVRGHRRHLGARRRLLRGLRRLRRRGHRLRPARPRAPASACAGSAAPWAFHQHHPPGRRRSSTSTTSCATPRSSTAAGAGGRCGAGSRAFAERGLAHYDADADRWLAGS